MADKEHAAFVLWLARQPHSSAAGRLSLRLFADLAAARLPKMPGSLREVKEWARTTRRDDREVQQLLAVAVKYWRGWLATTTPSALEREVTQ